MPASTPRSNRSSERPGRHQVAGRAPAGATPSAYRNVLNGAVFERATRRQRYDRRAAPDDAAGLLRSPRAADPRRIDGAVAALNHTVGFGDLTLRYGAEAAVRRHRHVELRPRRGSGPVNDPPVQSEDVAERAAGRSRAAALYADRSGGRPTGSRRRPACSGTFLDIQGQPLEELGRPAGRHRRLALRGAVAAGRLPQGCRSAAALHALARHHRRPPAERAPAVARRQHRHPGAALGRASGRRASSRRSSTSARTSGLERRRSPTRRRPRHRRRPRSSALAATANLWLGHGIGVFGTVGVAPIRRSGPATASASTFRSSPERFARAGLTFVHPSRLRFTLAQTFVGERTGDLAGDAPRQDSGPPTPPSPGRRRTGGCFSGLTLLNLLRRRLRARPRIRRARAGPSRRASRRGSDDGQRRLRARSAVAPGPSLWRHLAIAALIAALLIPVSFFRPFGLVEARLYDILSTIAPPPAAAAGAVDRGDRRALLRGSRPALALAARLHARLVDGLRKAGAQVIAFDIIFAEPSCPEADAALAARSARTWCSPPTT